MESLAINEHLYFMFFCLSFCQFLCFSFTVLSVYMSGQQSLHLSAYQGDEIWQFFTNQATFCRLIEAISPPNVNILGSNLLHFHQNKVFKSKLYILNYLAWLQFQLLFKILGEFFPNHLVTLLPTCLSIYKFVWHMPVCLPLVQLKLVCFEVETIPLFVTSRSRITELKKEK